MSSRNDQLDRVRAKMRERLQNRRDADEFRPPKVKKDETLILYFKVLPPLAMKDRCKTGINDVDTGLWWYENGNHFINNQRYECPRSHGTGEECPVCKLGFEMMGDSTDKKYRSNIAKQFLSKSYYAANIYFINEERNPESYRDKVMWYNMPNQIFKKMEACVNNDSPGTDDDPKAFGVFWEPEECYLFKLVITNSGEFNDYETSCFLPKSLSPLAKKSDGSPDSAKIAEILAQRHVLSKKFRAVDLAALKKIAANLNSANPKSDDPEQGAESGEGDGVEPNVEDIPGVTRGVKTEEKAEEPKKVEEPKQEEPKEPKKAAADPEQDPELANLLQTIQNKKKKS